MKLFYLTLLLCFWLVFADPSLRMQDANAPLNDHTSMRLASLRIITSDDQTFTVTEALARQSLVIEAKLQDLDTDPIITLPNVTANGLQKAIDWCNHHINDYKDMPVYMDVWDELFFVQLNQTSLFDVILAGYHLDINRLVEMGTKTVARMIKGKSVEEIRTIFRIEDDFTPEEEAQIVKENAWVEQH